MPINKWITKNIECEFIKNKPAGKPRYNAILDLASYEIKKTSFLDPVSFTCSVVFMLSSKALLRISFDVEHGAWPTPGDVVTRARRLARAHIKEVYQWPN